MIRQRFHMVPAISFGTSYFIWYQLFHLVDAMVPPLPFPRSYLLEKRTLILAPKIHNLKADIQRHMEPSKQTLFNETDLFRFHPSISQQSYLYVGLIVRKCALSPSKKNQLYRLIMIDLVPQFPQGKQNRAGDQFLYSRRKGYRATILISKSPLSRC